MEIQSSQGARNIFFTDFYEKSRGIRLSVGVDATNMCQLGCKYCYFGQKGKRKMNVGKIAPAIQNLADSFGSKLISVDVHYLGGEPLLAWDEILQLNPIVKELLERKGIKFTWSMTSNLVALNEHEAEYMIKENAGIHCSIDGPAFIQNKNRPYLDGRGSYADVAKNIPLALSVTPNDIARATVCPDDAKFLPEISETILGLGFQQVFLYPSIGLEWEEKHIDDWAEGIAVSYAKSGGLKNENIGTLIRLVKSKERKKFSYCGAGRELWSLDVDGNLYHCYHFSNMRKLAIIDASVNSASRIRAAIEQSLLPPQCKELPEKCLECPASYFCSGGCWSSNYLYMGNSSIALKSHCRISIATVIALKDRFIEAEDMPIMDETCVQCTGCAGCEVCTSYEGCW